MAAMVATSEVVWTDWWRRFEEQQAHHLPRREERFELMLELVETVSGDAPPTVLDLACGTGAISARVLKRFPSAGVVAVDADPLLLEIGKRTLGDADGRLTWLRLDLREPSWAEQVSAFGPFDAVLSSTALHWLPAGDLVRVYRRLADLVRPGGLFLNAEHLLVGPTGGRLAELTEQLRQTLTQREVRPGETWDAWWQSARAEAGFADLLAERARVFHDHPHHEHISAQFHEAALTLAGFAETAVVWRYLDDAILAGLR
jgi:SAM-dependent methyltransferase